jgi:multidrug efflux pump subunit AcrA (membrane-fusion protein)
VQVRLVTASDFQITAVPKTALYNVGGLTKIFVIRDNKAVECKIPPGVEIDGWTEVPPDLVRPGDQIAVSSLQNLVTGQPVRTQSVSGTKG